MRRIPTYESVAGLTSLAIPAVGVLLGAFGVPFAPRYVLFGAVAIAVTLPLAAWRLTSSSGSGDLVLFLAMLLPFGWDAGRTLLSAKAGFVDPVENRPMLRQALHEPQPVGLAGGIGYLELWYYLSPAEQPRAIYVADPRSELQQTGSDTIDRGYLALARWTPVPVVPYDEFVVGASVVLPVRLRGRLAAWAPRS